MPKLVRQTSVSVLVPSGSVDNLDRDTTVRSIVMLPFLTRTVLSPAASRPSWLVSRTASVSLNAVCYHPGEPALRINGG